MIKKISSLTETQWLWLLTIAAALLAWRIIYIQHGWINDDSVLYFEVARLFSAGEWKQGLTLYNWPLYPAILAFLHKATTANIQLLAQILNILFFALATYGFTSIIRMAGGGRLTLCCGGMLLFSSPYIVGNVLAMLLRDEGFWAFFLLSIQCFIRFYRSDKFNDALLWQLSAVMAVLFRVEAVIFLLGLPFALMLQFSLPLRQRLFSVVKINTLPLILLVIATSLFIFIPTLHLSDLGRLQEVITILPRLATDVAQQFSAKAQVMNSQILGSFLNDFGLSGIILTLIWVVVFKSLNIISLPVIGIFALGRAVKLPAAASPTMEADVRLVLLSVLALALLNAYVIIASVFVLSGRYLVPIGLIVLIFAAFQLEVLVKSAFVSKYSHWKKWGLLILLVILALFFVKNILPKQAGYNFEQDAIAYIKQHGIANEQVFFVTPRARYYANAPYAGRGQNYWSYTKQAIEDGSIYKYDYLMLNLDVDNDFSGKQKVLSDKLPQYQLIQEFYGIRKKKKVMLFKRN